MLKPGLILLYANVLDSMSNGKKMLQIKQQKQMGNLKTKWNMKGTNCLEEIFM
jgi:hypothetical protein